MERDSKPRASKGQRRWAPRQPNTQAPAKPVTFTAGQATYSESLKRRRAAPQLKDSEFVYLQEASLKSARLQTWRVPQPPKKQLPVAGQLRSGPWSTFEAQKVGVGNLLEALVNHVNTAFARPADVDSPIGSNAPTQGAFQQTPISRKRAPQLQAKQAALSSPLACLSTSFSNDTSDESRDARTRAIFDEIDLNKDGRLTADELQAYAARNGLPTAYVREFLANAHREAVVGPILSLLDPSAGRSSGDPLVPSRIVTPSGERVGRPPARLPVPFLETLWFKVKGSRFGRGTDASVDFAAFKHFVESKDAALRESFERIDADGDGEITVEELQEGISHVRVLCGGANAQKYRPVKKICAVEMMQTINKEKGQTISFEEFRDFFTLLPSEDYLLDYWLSVSRCGAIDTGSNVQVLSRLDEKDAHGSPWNHLIAGGLAGAASRTATAPLETLRLRMMVQSGSSMQRLAQDIFKSAGWRGFFGGNLTNVVRSAPQKAIDFFSFEAYKQLLGKQGGDSAVLVAGALAGATSTVILYPLDVVRSRLTVDTARKYQGIVHALKLVAKEEGFGALYRGLGPSVVSIIPEAAICYGAFDMLKKTYKRVTRKDDIGVFPALSCGVISAFTGQLVSYPLELVTRRLQVQGAAVAGAGGAVTRAAYRGMPDALVTILREEGIGGLYRGIVPASIKVIPMASISFGVYELAKHLLVMASEASEMRRLKEAEIEAEKIRRPRVVTHGEVKIPSQTEVARRAAIEAAPARAPVT